MKEGNPQELLHNFLLCVEKVECREFDVCEGDYEDENQYDDAAIGVEAETVNELQNAFEKRITIDCLIEAKDVDKEDKIRGDTPTNQMDMCNYSAVTQDKHKAKNLHEHV